MIFVLYEIFLIFICMFAAIGIVEVVLCVFTWCLVKKSQYKCDILLEDVSKADAETTIRLLETLIFASGIDCAVGGIRLGENVDVSSDVLRRLEREYGNITFLGDTKQ